MASIVIYDPEDLDDAERDRAAAYAALPEPEFDEVVAAFIDAPAGRPGGYCSALTSRRTPWKRSAGCMPNHWPPKPPSRRTLTGGAGRSPGPS